VLALPYEYIMWIHGELCTTYVCHQINKFTYFYLYIFVSVRLINNVIELMWHLCILRALNLCHICQPHKACFVKGLFIAESRNITGNIFGEPTVCIITNGWQHL
jgi:hypothetical protein